MQVIWGLAEKHSLNQPASIISSNDCVLLSLRGALKHLFSRTREQLWAGLCGSRSRGHRFGLFLLQEFSRQHRVNRGLSWGLSPETPAQLLGQMLACHLWPPLEEGLHQGEDGEHGDDPFQGYSPLQVMLPAPS